MGTQRSKPLNKQTGKQGAKLQKQQNLEKHNREWLLDCFGTEKVLSEHAGR